MALEASATPTRVLVVDDEPVTANIYAITLERAGYAIKLAASSEEALGLLGQERFELVLLDLYFPGTGGWVLLSKIREQFLAQELPVVVLSAESNEGVRTGLLALGANDFVVKPVHPPALLELVKLRAATRKGDGGNEVERP
jgi:DNA-binding response OmpR family regulator